VKKIKSLENSGANLVRCSWLSKIIDSFELAGYRLLGILILGGQISGSPVRALGFSLLNINKSFPIAIR
jgi:hypothetical protein